MAKILAVDPDKCTGCAACELACSMRNVEEFNPSRSRIRIMSFAPEFHRFPMVCLQCDTPPCAQICPTGAITRDEATGIVRVSKTKCIGCKMCAMACPFGNIFVSAPDKMAIKCELCDGDPQCVLFCSTKALEFKEPEAAMIDKRRALSEKLIDVYYWFKTAGGGV